MPCPTNLGYTREHGAHGKAFLCRWAERRRVCVCVGSVKHNEAQKATDLCVWCKALADLRV